MEKFSKVYSDLLYESLVDKVENKLGDKYVSLKRGLLDLIEKSEPDFGEPVKVHDFIVTYLEDPQAGTLEDFVDDGDIFNFYLKFQADIDLVCRDRNYFSRVPQEQDIVSLYDYVIEGTKYSIEMIMKNFRDEIFPDVK
jgi:hypothetical protein